MKRLLLTLFAFIITVTLFAQAPNAFNYQGIARDLSGNPILNKNIGLRISILQGTITGAEVYKELHLISTNNTGLFNIQIGKGTPVSGLIESINWGNGPFFLKIEMDETGGSNFKLIGTNQLLSVPYALYAEKSGSSFNLQPPSVIATDATNIGINSATFNGKVNGNGFKTDVVFEYGTTTQFGQTKSINPIYGSNDNTVSVGISGLQQGSKYYYRIVASNAVNTSTSNIISFQLPALPTVVTSTINTFTSTTALLGGNVTSDGNATVTERGVCFGTSQNPTTANNKTVIGSGTGAFSTTITGLTANTTYYVRAYAVNSMGTTYGQQVSFTTSPSGNQTGTFTDSRDGKIYKWVKIGSQIWMAENLAYLPAVNPSNTFSFVGYKYYVYGYEGNNVAEAKATNNYLNYGVLYNWIAAMQGSASSNTEPSGIKGICPDGWHLPSKGEWYILKQYLIDNGYGIGGSGPYIAKSLAAKTSWSNSSTEGTPGFEPDKNNSSGFSALASGILVYHTFSGQNVSAFWWSATNYGSSTPETTAEYFRVDNNSPAFPSYGDDKSDAFSVRCLKD